MPELYLINGGDGENAVTSSDCQQLDADTTRLPQR